MALRSYQKSGIEKLDLAFRAGFLRVLAVAPTGAGKGTMAAHLMARVAKSGRRALFVVHRREIVMDVANRIRTGFRLPVGTVIPGQPRRPEALVQVASVQSLSASKALPAADLVVVDEAHHYMTEEWGRVLAYYGSTPMIGFSATPCRADGKPMGDIFDELVVVARYSQLLRGGYIVPCRVLAPPEALGVDLAQHPVTAYRRYASGRRALVYARDVKQATQFYNRFRREGIRASLVHASTPARERKAALEALDDGSAPVLVNVYTMTEGIDVPAVDTVVLCRACEHYSTYVQICGRALRASKGKSKALLLDLTGASRNHGLPTADREMSLTSETVLAEEDEEGEAGHAVEKPESKILGIDLVELGRSSPGASGGAVPQGPMDSKWDEYVRKISDGAMSVKAAVGAFRFEFRRGPGRSRLQQLSPEVKEREWKRLKRRMPVAKARSSFQALFGEPAEGLQ